VLAQRAPIITAFLHLSRQVPRFFGRRHRYGVLRACAPLLMVAGAPAPVLPRHAATIISAKAIQVAHTRRAFRTRNLTVITVDAGTVFTAMDPRAPRDFLISTKAIRTSHTARGRTGRVLAIHGPLASAVFSAATRPRGAIISRKAIQTARKARGRTGSVLAIRGPKAVAVFYPMDARAPRVVMVTKKARALATQARGRTGHVVAIHGPPPGIITSTPIQGAFTGGPHAAATWQGGAFTLFDFTGGPYTRVTWNGDP
jgi:hypothetical protein